MASDLLGIYLVPLGGAFGARRAELLEPLGRRLAQTLGCAVEVTTCELDLALSHERGRDQHNALVLLEQLAALPLDPAARRLGLCEADLFIPMLTHVFGLAQLRGPAAIVSSHRLAPDPGSTLRTAGPAPKDLVLLRERLEKESLHELGHTFGLVHCTGPECVMHSATDVLEVDLRAAHFCRRCRAHLPSR